MNRLLEIVKFFIDVWFNFFQTSWSCIDLWIDSIAFEEILECNLSYFNDINSFFLIVNIKDQAILSFMFLNKHLSF